MWVMAPCRTTHNPELLVQTLQCKYVVKSLRTRAGYLKESLQVVQAEIDRESQQLSWREELVDPLRWVMCQKSACTGCFLVPGQLSLKCFSVFV